MTRSESGCRIYLKELVSLAGFLTMTFPNLTDRSLSGVAVISVCTISGYVRVLVLWNASGLHLSVWNAYSLNSLRHSFHCVTQLCPLYITILTIEIGFLLWYAHLFVSISAYFYPPKHSVRHLNNNKFSLGYSFLFSSFFSDIPLLFLLPCSLLFCKENTLSYFEFS